MLIRFHLKLIFIIIIHKISGLTLKSIVSNVQFCDFKLNQTYLVVYCIRKNVKIMFEMGFHYNQFLATKTKTALNEDSNFTNQSKT